MRLFNVGKLFGRTVDGTSSGAPNEDGRSAMAATEEVADAAMASPLFESILSFWYARQTDGAVPDWSVFHPSDHPKLLSHIVLFEVSEDRFFARVVGETVVRHLPMKLANQFLDDVALAGLSDLTAQIARTRDKGEPTYTDQSDAWALDQDRVGYMALCLPFQDRSGAMDRVLSVVLFRLLTGAG